MPTSVRYMFLALGVLVSLAGAWTIVHDTDSKPEADPGRRPSVAEWTELSLDLEETVPARALLGGIRNSILDEALSKSGLSRSGFQSVGKELIGRASAGVAEQRSVNMSHEAFSYFEVPNDVQPMPIVNQGRKGKELDYETEALVQRLLRRLPGES